MSERAERLFSYGTLQLESVQRVQFGRVLEGVADALVGFREDIVEITDPDVLVKSGERFHPIVSHSGKDADRVPGTLFLITSAELAAADAYEVSDYARVEAPLASGSRAWVYVKRA
ncbi:MAG: gamma-glutamylcyclotransferase [Hyphomonadaceae bacterium JAD_PAG50586_4]|nr:MAG: gamma-glutamylcyclotransferase [Hyphomonadaceae bacterium JAD_PAG50586_4]